MNSGKHSGLEECSASNPGKNAKLDKASILSDATRMLTQLRGETEKLKESNSNLRETIKDLKVEKNELRDEKLSLKAERKGWNNNSKQQVLLLQDLLLICLIQLHSTLPSTLHLHHPIKSQPTKELRYPLHSLEWRCGTGCPQPPWTQLKIQSFGRRMLRRADPGMLDLRCHSPIGKSERLSGP
eukprot:UN32368